MLLALGYVTRITSTHPLFILNYPVTVDNIHPKAYWESIHLLMIFLP